MVRRFGQSLFLLLLLSATGGGLFLYKSNHTELEAERQKSRQLAERAEKLEKYKARLEVTRRVADIMVTDQSASGDGTIRTTIRFVEYAQDGSTALPGRDFTFETDTAHIDALIVKFDGKFVEENDALRGHSIALFTRIYGHTEKPSDGRMIDEPGKVPEIYRGADPASRAFQEQLWADFWKLADDPKYRAEKQVRVAQGEGIWYHFRKGLLYTLSLESNGGLNITNEPLKPIFEQVLRGAQTPDSQPSGLH